MNPDDIELRDHVAHVCFLLVSNGADLNISTSSNKDTPLHYFANFGFCQLAQKCSVDLFPLENKNGWTCLHFAAESGQYEMIKYILTQLPRLRKRTTNNKLLPIDLTKHNFPRCTALLATHENQENPKSVRFAESVKNEIEDTVISDLLLNWQKLPNSILIPQLHALLSRQSSEIKQLREQITDQAQKIQTFDTHSL